jgi:hypothetical protein
MAATLELAVPQIVCLRASPEMLRVNAAWNVAGMTDDQSIRQGPIQRFPHHAVRVQDTLADAYAAVSVPFGAGSMHSASPQPASRLRYFDSPHQPVV